MAGRCVVCGHVDGACAGSVPLDTTKIIDPTRPAVLSAEAKAEHDRQRAEQRARKAARDAAKQEQYRRQGRI